MKHVLSERMGIMRFVNVSSKRYTTKYIYLQYNITNNVYILMTE